MLKRTITGVALAAIALVCIWLQGYFVVGALVIVSLVCMREMLESLKKSGRHPVEWADYLYILSAGVAQCIVLRMDGGVLESVAASQLVLALASVIGFAAVVARGKVDLEKVFSTLVPMLYPGMFCSLLYAFNCIEGKMFTLIGLVLCVFVSNLGDAGALLVGVHFGKHKLSPQISPKKTWEGAVGGLVVAVLSAILLPHMFRGVMWLVPYTRDMVQALPAWWKFAIMGVFAGFAGQFGDLAASMVKRECGVKDFGTIFPGHGGMLDRLDGVFFSSAVILVSFLIMGV